MKTARGVEQQDLVAAGDEERAAVGTCYKERGQAAALIRLAWGPDESTSPLVRAAARRQLAGFGKHALRPLRETFREIEPRFQADAAEVAERITRVARLAARFV